MTGPSSRPKRLGEQLMECGFVKKDEMTGMALNFSKLKSDFEQTPGLHIEIVTDEKNLKDWARGPLDRVCLDDPENDASFFL